LYTHAPARLALIDDPAAMRLLPLKFSLPIRAASRLPLGTRAAHRVLGLMTHGVTFDVALRTAAIDDVIRDAISDGATQLVLLGAGLDTRAWRMPELERCTVFELDYPSTQAYKRPRIESIEPLAAEVRFGSIDFERQNLAPALLALKFDEAARTIWVCEGVAMFLTRASVDALLDGIGRSSAPGSVVALTYLPEHRSSGRRHLIQVLANAAAEPVKTLLAREELHDSLRRRGLLVWSDEAASDWAARYWPKRAAQRVRDWERLVVAKR
jgi:methyltransferase (TIGR00027 family)